LFIDKAEIFIKAGNGGNGAVAFRREIYVPESVERVKVEVFGNGIFDNYKNIAVPNHLSGMFIYNGRARIKYY